LRWETPERFNFGREVVDAWPDDRPALKWLGADGEERRLTFGDFSRLSNRFANAMRSLGVGRGDRVMVLLGKVPEWQAILTGLLKLGAIAIPCAPQLRTWDLKFRGPSTPAPSPWYRDRRASRRLRRCAAKRPA
jgi:acyl-coenzyme A synthetase/AMP-(fatty) acid ligase